jgi:hypothetical protein
MSDLQKPHDMPASLWNKNGHVEDGYGTSLSELEKVPDGAELLESWSGSSAATWR